MPPMLIDVAEDVAAAEVELAVELMSDMPDMFMVVDMDIDMPESSEERRFL